MEDDRANDALKRGEIVRVTLDDRTGDAFVALASENGRSLMLFFDGMFGGYINAMPVLDKDGTGDYHELFGGRPVLIERRRKG